jgi:hypothetical protein
LRRLLTRRIQTFIQNKADVKAKVDEYAPRLFAWGEHSKVGWEGLANWVILARFLASGGRQSR